VAILREHAMNNLARWKVRGSVRILRQEHAEWDRSQGSWQAPRGVSIVTFRRDGQASEFEFHNPDGSVARWARVYDDDGRLMEQEFWSDDGPRSRVVYSYDARGRLAAAEAVAPDGTQREAETYRYDATGRKVKVTLLAHDPTGSATCYALEGTEQSYGAPGAVTLTVAYDDRELPAEARFDDADGALVRRIVFSRDQEGRLLSEVEHFGGESPFPEFPADVNNIPAKDRASMAAALKRAFEDRVFCRTAYAYDTKGRLLERTIYMGTLSEDRTTFQYRDYDDPIAETSSSRNHRVALDDDGVVSTTEEQPGVQQYNRYDYQYDSHGNWTERVLSYRIDSEAEFQRSNIERRTFEYYE
jgi:hypothetical protein